MLSYSRFLSAHSRPLSLTPNLSVLLSRLFFLLFLLQGIPVHAAVPTNGLIAYWPFDDAKGTTATDSSGNSNNALLMNSPTWATGKFAGDIAFDGVDDVVYVNSTNFNFTGDLTVSVWFKQSPTAGDLKTATLLAGSDEALMPKFILYLDRQYKRVCLSSPNGVECTPFNSYTTAGTWTHIVLVRPATGQNITTYINNVLQQGTLFSGTPIPVSRVTIGRLAINSARFAGEIDEVRLYTRQLAPTEVQSLFEIAPSSPSPSPNFVFDLTPTQSSLSVLQGSSATNTISVTLVSTTSQLEHDTRLAQTSPNVLTRLASVVSHLSPGPSLAYASPNDPIVLATATTSPISFSAIGLPPGATASFSSTNCVPNCTTALTVTTASSTPVGTYKITAVGSGGGATDTATFDLAVTAPSPSPTPTTNLAPTAGLIAHWKLDEGAGITTANAVGTSPAATMMNGPTWTAGKTVTALSLDGSNDFVDTNFSVGSGSNFTIAYWFKTTQNTAVTKSPFGAGDPEVDSDNFSSFFNPGGVLNRISCFVRDTAGDNWVNAQYDNAALFDGNWHLYTCTLTNTTVMLYIDGIARNSATNPVMSSITLNQEFFIGAQNNRGSASFNFAGAIDEVRVYNRGLTSQEVSSLYNPSATSPPPPPPPADTTAPVRSTGAPSGVLSAGTTQTTLSLTTNEKATCKYSPTAGTAYAAMTNTFATTGNTSHSTVVTGLQNGQSYSYRVRCQDVAGNANLDDFTITFSIAQPQSGGDTTAPLISKIILSNITSTSATAGWTTNEFADTQIEYGPTTSYGKETTLDPSRMLVHTQTFFELSPNTLHHYRVKSKDAAGNLAVSEDQTFTTSSASTATCDTGTADAPCRPADKRTIIVDQSGKGDYTDILPALQNAQPGDTIKVKNGIYTCPSCGSAQGGYLMTRSGTKDLPITLTNFPEHRPQLRITVTVWAEWILIEGLEIAQINGDGIHLNYNLTFNQRARHITIRNNWVHENGFMGMYTAALSDLLIEQNVFERNGRGPGDCLTNWTGGAVTDNYRYAHCHGIYMNNSTGTTSNTTPTTGVTVRRNKFIENAGFGWTNRSDGVRSTNYLIENNLFVNNSLNQGFIDLNQSIIRNNTLAIFTYAQPNDAQKTCYYSNHVAQNVIANNVCYSTIAPNEAALYPIHSWAVDSTIANTWTHNAFFVKAGTPWRWGGQVIQGFLDTYTAKTLDVSPLLLPVTAGNGSEAGFINALGGNFDLTTASPLIGAGDPTQCPAADIDGVPRPSGTCDIGAYTK